MATLPEKKLAQHKKELKQWFAGWYRSMVQHADAMRKSKEPQPGQRRISHVGSKTYIYSEQKGWVLRRNWKKMCKQRR